MKIHFMKDDALAYFKGNVANNLNHYLDKDNKWIYEKYAGFKGADISPFEEFKLDVPEFQMDMSTEKAENTDFTNVQILYSALKCISDTQASDERFWVGLAHAELWEFMRYRCKLSEERMKENKILTNYFFNYGNKRSLIVHPLARMWWVGRLIYNEKSKSPFEALEYMRNDFGTKVLSLFSSNFTNNPHITRAILIAIATLEKSNFKVSRSAYLEILRYVNALGGIIILDYLTEDELKNKIIKHYCEINGLSLDNSDIIDNTDKSIIKTDFVEDTNKPYVEENTDILPIAESTTTPKQNSDLYTFVIEQVNIISQNPDNFNLEVFKKAKNIEYSSRILGVQYPFIREINTNLTIERQCQYKSRKGVYNKQPYTINGFSFLVLNSNFVLDRLLFDKWFSELDFKSNMLEKEYANVK